MPRLSSPDPLALGPLVTLEEAIAAGLTADQVRQRVRSGRWTRLGRGRYLRECALDTVGDAWQVAAYRHALVAISAAIGHKALSLVHGSAAMVHQLPLLGGPPQHSELGVPPNQWSGTRAGVRIGRSITQPNELTSAGEVVPELSGPHAGVLITSVARTWFDLAQRDGMAQALIVGDEIARSHAHFLPDLARVTARNGRGVNHAARAIEHISPLRENPLESLSYAHFLMWKIPLPRLQEVIVDDEGFVARVDFLWPDLGIVGEADGAGKYTNRGALVAEKLREDRLRRLGYLVVRWTWDELINTPWVVRSRLLTALAQAA